MKKIEYIKQGRLVSFRLSRVDDIPMIVEWRNKNRVRMNHIYREAFTIDGQKAWRKKNIDTGRAVQIIICENAKKGNEKRAIGCVHFHSIDAAHKSAEYGIYIGEDDAIGKGYGNEAAIMALEYASDAMGIKTVFLKAFTSNEVAIKSYYYAGFEKIGNIYSVACSDGTKEDMVVMEKRL